jgi:hypothetical protein
MEVVDEAYPGKNYRRTKVTALDSSYYGRVPHDLDRNA